MMELIRRSLNSRYGPTRIADPQPAGRLTVRQADKQLSQEWRFAERPTAGAFSTTENGILTAWFDPWAHQSGEQIWAGLVQAIVESAAPVLYPDERKRESYWFARNIARIDRHALRRELRKRIISPFLGAALVAIAVPLSIGLIQAGSNNKILGHSAVLIAALLPSAFLLVGVVHTFLRYFRSHAADHLPASLVIGPIGGTGPRLERDTSGGAGQPGDPLTQASRGSLHQHDIQELLADIRTAGYELIVFIDDLDRCRPATTAEVFEAINLFVSGINSTDLHARFVLGIRDRVPS